MTTIGPPSGSRAPSPLDPFLRPFLEQVGALADGYSPVSHAPAVAETLGWHPAFVDAVYTSARAQGLLEPYRGRGGRGRNRWRVSRRGAAWLAESAPEEGERIGG